MLKFSGNFLRILIICSLILEICLADTHILDEQTVALGCFERVWRVYRKTPTATSKTSNGYVGNVVLRKKANACLGLF